MLLLSLKWARIGPELYVVDGDMESATVHHQTFLSCRNTYIYLFIVYSCLLLQCVSTRLSEYLSWSVNAWLSSEESNQMDGPG